MKKYILWPVGFVLLVYFVTFIVFAIIPLKQVPAKEVHLANDAVRLSTFTYSNCAPNRNSYCDLYKAQNDLAITQSLMEVKKSYADAAVSRVTVNMNYITLVLQLILFILVLFGFWGMHEIADMGKKLKKDTDKIQSDVAEHTKLFDDRFQFHLEKMNQLLLASIQNAKNDNSVLAERVADLHKFIDARIDIECIKRELEEKKNFNKNDRSDSVVLDSTTDEDSEDDSTNKTTDF